MNYEYVTISLAEVHRFGSEGWHVVPGIFIKGVRVPDQILMEREVTPSIPGVEMINGGELRIGDRVLIECEITGEDDYNHMKISERGIGKPWMPGDQYLWTWSGQHGSGGNSTTGEKNKDIMRIIT